LKEDQVQMRLIRSDRRRGGKGRGRRRGLNHMTDVIVLAVGIECIQKYCFGLT